MNGKGLRQSPPEKVVHRLGAHHLLGAAVAAPLKGSAQLVTIKPNLNQGESSCCHAHSGVAAVWCALTAAGASPAYLGSPLMLASCTYADVRAATTVAPYAPLQDTGADLQDDGAAMAKWGLAPIKSLPTDVPPDSVDENGVPVPFPEPDPAQLVEGSKDLIGGEYTIPSGPGAAHTVAQCLDAGIPVWIGFFCDSNFENAPSDFVRGVPDPNDPNGGGHAVYLSGYRTSAAGDLEFRLENSWGAWCDNGGCWVSAAFVEACWSLWPCPVKVTS